MTPDPTAPGPWWPYLMQGLSLSGAALILGAYWGNLSGRLQTSGLLYGLLNLAGSLLVAASAVLPPNYGVLLLEFAWAGLSLAGIARALRARPPAPPDPGPAAP